VGNRFSPSEKGRNIEEDVTVFTDGNKAFHGWENLKITKNLESIANTFQLDIDDRFQETGERWPLKPGVGIQIEINRERVITGRIEEMRPSFGIDGRRLTLAGRSLPGDLVDCSHLGPCEYKNISLDRLAEELIKPFGLEVFLSVEPKVIDKFAIKPGESVFESLDRAARTQGFFWVSTRDGNIRLTRRARARSDSEIHQNVNMISGSGIYDNSKRHSEYIVRGQTQGSDDFPGELAGTAEGRAKDLGIEIHRPIVIIAEGNVDTEQAKTRAGWEASVRIGQALELNVVVQGWRQETESLWGINQVILVKSEFLGVNGDFLSAEVEHRKGKDSPTETQIRLVRPDAYESKPEFPKDDDPLAFLGPGFN